MSGPATATERFSAELVGTFVLVFSVVSTAVMSRDLVATAFAAGFAVLVMVYAVGRVSGGHFNPAVSVGAALGGRLSWSMVPLYVGAQLAGALLAGTLLFALFHGFEGFDATGNMGQNFYGDQGTGFAWWAALLLELVLTMVFVWVILAVTDSRNEHPALAPLAIGLALTMIHFASIPATGTSVNPARSIGVGIYAGSDAIIQLWLFIVAPLLGACAAGATYAALFGQGAAPVPGSGWIWTIRRVAPAAVPGYGAPDQYQQEWNPTAQPSPSTPPPPETTTQQWPSTPPPAPPDEPDPGHTAVRPQG